MSCSSSSHVSVALKSVGARNTNSETSSNVWLYRHRKVAMKFRAVQKKPLSFLVSASSNSFFERHAQRDEPANTHHAETAEPYSKGKLLQSCALAFGVSLLAFQTVLPALAEDVSGPASLAAGCPEAISDSSSPDMNTWIVIACVAEFVALTGAAVGGYVARIRKQEVEKINAQLRQINVNLRRQARVEAYAPGLSYAPVGAPRIKISPASGTADEATADFASGASQVASVASAERSELSGSAASGEGSSMKGALILQLREGKQRLRESDNVKAIESFKEALEMARRIGDLVEEKKAARGVGASLQRLGKYSEAIDYHKIILALSERTGRHAGDIEAYGAIADCYTELGDLENAAKYYDWYIQNLTGKDESEEEG